VVEVPEEEATGEAEGCGRCVPWPPGGQAIEGEGGKWAA
jgi:hypothetical protein